jgi:predicted helicase
VEAIGKITAAFESMDRATAVMACGAGKTLTALWTAESMGARTILVLLPNLSLVRQTFCEWANENGWGDRFTPICICSDRTVPDNDSIVVVPGDLPFPVTTDPGVAATFLSGTKSDDRVRVVFSTYQSSEVIGRSLPPDLAFDLGVFDEAHKTTGSAEKSFGFALRDVNIRMSKRLFVTAKPRVHNYARRDVDGNAVLINSMDDETVYGPVVYRLSFREAAERGIILPYKIIVSVVTSAELGGDLHDSHVLIDGKKVPARHVAGQVALRKAVQEYNLAKAFTFHAGVQAARDFTGDGPFGMARHLPAFLTSHVSGQQNTFERDAVIGRFRRAEHGLLSNARCLTEGVDVPAVDLVAFIDPKKSRVDIVQAIGHTLRRGGLEKKYGYVLLPVFVEQADGESVEEAVARADFRVIWQVLSSLMDNDEDLANVINALRTD